MRVFVFLRKLVCGEEKLRGSSESSAADVFLLMVLFNMSNSINAKGKEKGGGGRGGIYISATTLQISLSD